MTPSGIAFDAFGTLFDMGALRSRAEDVLGSAGDELIGALPARLLPLTWHATAAGRYRPFPEMATLALLAIARERGLGLDHARAGEIAAGLATLPAYPDAEGALRDLAPIPLAVLTNGTRAGIESLLAGAGLGRRFAHVLVADAVGRFKPAPEVYALAVDAFGCPPGSVLLVSGNEWDVAGAKHAGLLGAWIARGRPQTGFGGVEADLVVERLSDLPGALRAFDR